MSKTFDPFDELMLNELPRGDLILRGIEELASGVSPFVNSALTLAPCFTRT